MAAAPTPKRRKATSGSVPAEPHIEDQPQQEPEAVDGVLLIKRIAEDGNINVDIQLIGDIRITEVATILSFGQKTFAERMGV